MSDYLFQPFPVVAAPVRGEAALFPLRRIFCVGRNYEAHAREMGVAVDREAPFFFMKDASAYVPSGATIPYPPGTANFHYEMELVVAIGKGGFRIAQSAALDHVYGYACGLDMTRRDLQLQARDKQRPWDLGKNFENAAVLSAIVPVTQCGHLVAGKIELTLNGTVKQSSDLSLLIHSVPVLIAHLSNFYHLQAGDLIFTGTPEGVGPVTAGDAIAGAIDGTGTIQLNIAAAE